MTDGLTGSTSETHTLGGVAAIQANRAARRQMRAGLREKLREERARLRRLPPATSPEEPVEVEATSLPPPQAAPLPNEPTPAEIHPPAEVECTVFGQLITDAAPPEAEPAPPEPAPPEPEAPEPEAPEPEAPEPELEPLVEAAAADLPPDEEEEPAAPILAAVMAQDAPPDLPPAEEAPPAMAVAEEAMQDVEPAAPPALPLPGMGPGMVLRLRHLGIESTAQMAEADPEALRRALGPISRLVNVEGWIAAARETA
ncbi:hypothetical protein [Roseococcus suduntuyensis]|nr:hypothetical protein [Roseococcus suduntuyensis]